jgi:hypothetical protein
MAIDISVHLTVLAIVSAGKIATETFLLVLLIHV